MNAIETDPELRDDARARLLLAARARFAVSGFEGASTRAIARDAGVAQSLLLYHFGSKDVLWRTMIDGMFADAGARLAVATTPTKHATIVERLQGRIRAFVALCAHDADLHRLMTMEGRSDSDRLAWLVETHLRPLFDEMCTLLREGQHIGAVRAGDPALLYYTIIAIAGTAYSLAPEIRLLTRCDNPPDRQAIEAMICAALFVDRQDTKA